MAEIILANFYLKSKTGSRKIQDIICLDLPIPQLQADRHVMFRILRDKLEGWKSDLIKDKETGYPVIEKMEIKKRLGESFNGQVV